MEVALEDSMLVVFDGRKIGFNPCFNGSCFGSFKRRMFSSNSDCFNPCFNGSCFGRRIGADSDADPTRFQSLF